MKFPYPPKLHYKFWTLYGLIYFVIFVFCKSRSQLCEQIIMLLGPSSAFMGPLVNSLDPRVPGANQRSTDCTILWSKLFTNISQGMYPKGHRTVSKGPTHTSREWWYFWSHELTKRSLFFSDIRNPQNGPIIVPEITKLVYREHLCELRLAFQLFHLSLPISPT